VNHSNASGPPSTSRVRLGNYEPLIELASGGMATVYVARQIGAAGFERLVVVKRVHRHHLGNKDFVDMLRDEARVASMVRHPNVVPVIDVVETERGSNVGMPGELFLVMEYVESTALSTLLKTCAQQGERLPPAVAVRIIADTLAGLHAAHEATDMRGESLHVVHRDVSPQNVLVAVDGASRLIDFGVAKAAHRLTETRSGSLKGKLAYMSPEQAMGLPIDRRVDIFAAGVALHEALTGRRLFQGENDFDTMRRIAEQPVPDPSSLVLSLPRALDPVVQRALERDPSERFQSASEFLEELERAVVPAPAREVAGVLNRFCGDRLAERRDQLSLALAGQGSVSDRFRVRPETVAETINPAQARMLMRESESLGRGVEMHSIQSLSQMSSAHDYLPSVPPSGSQRVRQILAATAAGVLTLTVIGVASWRLMSHRDGRDDVVVAANPSVGTTGASGTTGTTAPSGLPGDPNAPPGDPNAPANPQAPATATGPSTGSGAVPTTAATTVTSTNTLPPVEGVELDLTADATIVTVRAVGVRRVEIEGNHARVVVAPWEGVLMIDAALAGGTVAHGTATAGDSADVKLVTTRSTATTRVTTGNGAGGGYHPRNADDLHKNPYDTKPQ
jgi:serine/threonine-protein kinase